MTDSPGATTATEQQSPGRAQVGPELLRRILSEASGRLDFDEMAQRLAGLITEATGSDVCFVHVIDHQRQRLVLSGATPPFDAHVGSIELAVGEGVAGWVAQRAEPVIVHDKWTDRRYKYMPELRGEDYVSFASVPMIARAGHVVGVLNVHARRPGHFSAEDVSILADLANLMADVVENARLHTELAQREAELGRFAEHTLQLQEADRERLAGDIHDGVSQRIVSLTYHLCAASDAVPPLPPEVLRQLAVARSLADAALDETRAAVSGLRPPLLDDLGLGACLRGLAGELPPGVTVDAEIVEQPGLDGHVEVAIYRMAQEILQNVAKHARAHVVTVRMDCDDDGCTLTVNDDGVGFDPLGLPEPARAATYGFASLRARAALISARVDVRSAPGKGTTVRLFVPRARAGDSSEGSRQPA